MRVGVGVGWGQGISRTFPWGTLEQSRESGTWGRRPSKLRALVSEDKTVGSGLRPNQLAKPAQPEHLLRAGQSHLRKLLRRTLCALLGPEVI